MPITKTLTEHRRARSLLATLGLAVLAYGCASDPQSVRYAQRHDSAPLRHVKLTDVKDAVPKAEPRSRYGNPASYVVRGVRYRTLANSKGYSERGVASWYGTKFHGYRTSSGEPYDMYGMTAAHKTLPLPTYARVTNLRNGRAVIVKINDRGPFHDNRLIDLSYAAAARLGILATGTGLVQVTAIDPATWHKEPAKPRIAPSRPKVAGAVTKNRQTAHKPLLYLQVGAFRDRGNAERLRSQLSRVELPAALRISASTTKDAPVYRVQIGPLASVDTADRLTERLAGYGIHSARVVID